MSITIWHNPRCSKSRQTLELLQENGIDPVVRHYLTDPPSADDILAVGKKMDQPISELTRQGEKIFKDLGLSLDGDDAVLAAALAAHPVLIERPIVMTETKAAIGRPPESVLDILPTNKG